MTTTLTRSTHDEDDRSRPRCRSIQEPRSTRSSTAGPPSASRWGSSAAVGWQSFHGHGLADIASGTPITEDTVFRIASITKTFTAIAVMQLWEQGLVDLDAPAQRLPARLPADPGQPRLPARDLAPPADPHRRGPRGASPVRPASGRTGATASRLGDRSRRSPSSTGAPSASSPSRAHGSSTPTTGSPPSSRSSRT